MSKVAVDNKIKDVYNKFKKNYKSAAKKLTYEQYLSILDKSNEIERRVLLKDGEYKLPYQLGVLEIVKSKCKVKNIYKSVNFQETKKQNRTILNFNDHSDGYIYKIYWNRRTCKLQDKQIWVFKTGRIIARQLAQVIKNKLNDYPDIR